MYGLLFKVVYHDVDQPIQVILDLPFRGLRAILPTMHSLVLALFALPLDFFSCTFGLGELIQIIKIMMDLFYMWQHILKAYSTKFI